MTPRFAGSGVDLPMMRAAASLGSRVRLRPQEELLFEWINPVYLDMNYQAQVQEEFEETSEILLKNFLKVSRHLLGTSHTIQ